jgi:hypothetical protein
MGRDLEARILCDMKHTQPHNVVSKYSSPTSGACKEPGQLQGWGSGHTRSVWGICGAGEEGNAQMMGTREGHTWMESPQWDELKMRLDYNPQNKISIQTSLQ